MNLTTNFLFREFQCKDGTPVPVELIDNAKELAENLQAFRDAVGKPVVINSAYRTERYNRMVGGASRSQHLKAKAADITVPGMTPKEVADKIEELIKEGVMKQGGLGRYKTFTHYDIRGYIARWGSN